jgi:methyl-accepting chemotaxis protein
MNKIDLLTTATMPLLQSMRDTIEEARVRFHSIGANLEEISALTRRQVQKVDGVVSDATERAQLQIVRLDGLVSDTIEKVERTSETLQRGVVKPVQEISAIVAGVKTAVDFLRHRKRGPVEHATQDEEMFI